jgi:hypothetical protein
MSFCTQFLTNVVLQQSKVGVGEHDMLGTSAHRLNKAGVTNECKLHSTFQQLDIETQLDPISVMSFSSNP